MRAWVITDGSSADEKRCLGVAEMVADRIERRRIAPRAPWRWLASLGVTDPADRLRVAETPDRLISPRWPEIAVASGAAASYLAAVRRASQGATATVLIGPSRASADINWTFEGRGRRSPSLIATPAPPHRMSQVRLAAARGAPPLARDAAGPRVGVIVGEGAAPLIEEDAARLLVQLRQVVEAGAALMVRLSPGAPLSLNMALRELAHYLWDGTGPDPYASVFAQSDAVVTTADAADVIAEAAATGRPVLVFRPSRARRRDLAVSDRLVALGVARRFEGRIERYAYAPLDSTTEIAHAIHALLVTRAALRPVAGGRTPARARETNGPAAR